MESKIEQIRKKLARLKAIQERRIAEKDTNATVDEIHALTYGEAMFLLNLIDDMIKLLTTD